MNKFPRVGFETVQLLCLSKLSHQEKGNKKELHWNRPEIEQYSILSERFVDHQGFKFGKVNFPIAVNIGLSDHVLDLLLGDGLAEVVHGEPELLAGDEAVAVAVEHLEGVSHVLLDIPAALHHHLNELIEVDGAVGVGVDVPDHAGEVVLGGLEAVGPHHLEADMN